MKGALMAKRNQRKFQILKILDDNRPNYLTARAIATRAGISIADTINLLRKYEKKGLVEFKKKVTIGKSYKMRVATITPEGEAVLMRYLDLYRAGYLTMPPALVPRPEEQKAAGGS
ncbi:MAG: hypothetical protein APZ16_04470 [Candidatus Hadarchaeum yellowstonense]|uniref:HTH marR-type domain-containing protein n=1 Tax=Hadarchaeum yellowstonense TaxID=1776334 RepID=A0A147JVV9_HADYE|nr:MAG: hypothetical protein APZ16_04470 [Candidatus Hadarchaeum yellowstonense]